MVSGAPVRRLGVAGARASATPVVLWGAWPFHRATWAQPEAPARRPWTRSSRSACSLPGCGRVYAVRGRRPAEHCTSRPPSVITTFVLAGRYARGAREAPRRRRAQGAARAGRQGRARVLDATAPSAACRSSSSSRRRPLRRAARARRWPPTAWSRRAPRPSTVELLTGESVPGRGRARRSEVAGATRERRRAARRARDAGWAPTPRSRRSPGWSTRGAVGQGAGAAARRPGGRGVCAGRDRARAGDVRVLAAPASWSRAPSPPPSLC